MPPRGAVWGVGHHGGGAVNPSDWPQGARVSVMAPFSWMRGRSAAVRRGEGGAGHADEASALALVVT
jgi:hypothetical protein